MSLHDYVDVVRRRWVSVAVPAVLAVLLAGLLSALATPTYTSTARMFFSLESGNSANDLAQGANFTQAQMASYATLVTTPSVLGPVVTELGLPESPQELARSVSARAANDTVVLEVSVTDTSAARAAEIADAVADQLGEVVSEVAPRNADGEVTVRSTVVAPAVAPLYPSSPNTKLNLAAGLLLGVVLGVLLALLREALDTRVRSDRQLRALTDAPLLGNLTADPASEDTVVVHDQPRSAQAELYRQLRTNTQFLQVSGRPLSMVVTSSLPGEGKSTVAMNLALALAEVSDRVLLVDADLRRPTVAARLGLEQAAGLSTVLVGRASFDDVVQEWGPRRLAVLTSGAVPPNPAQLLSSGEMAELAAELLTRYEVVVWDAPPLLPVTDARLLSRHADGVVMVASGRLVRRPQLAEALQALRRVDARLLGVVMNMVSVRAQAAERGYGSYELPAVPEPRWTRLRLRARGGEPAPVAPSAAIGEVPAGELPPPAAAVRVTVGSSGKGAST
ncbi:polysaccharide biosynthesis tyrosine autokinase [Modestobacter sp. SYSU DS0511]